MPSASLEATSRSASAPQDVLFFGWPSLHVQENSQHQCRLHCAMHYCGHAKRPHRLVPRAGPGQNKGALRCNLGARSPGNNDFAVYAPRNFLATFCAQSASAPGTRRPLGGQNAQNGAAFPRFLQTCIGEGIDYKKRRQTASEGTHGHSKYRFP